MFSMMCMLDDKTPLNYSCVIISVMASQITSLAVVHSTAYTGADKRKHQSSTSLAFERGIHRWPVNSSHKGPVTRKMVPFDDVIMSFSPQVRWVTMTTIESLRWMMLETWLPTETLTHQRFFIVYIWCLVISIKIPINELAFILAREQHIKMCML